MSHHADRVAHWKAVSRAEAAERARRALALSLQATQAQRERRYHTGPELAHAILTVDQVRCIRMMDHAGWKPTQIRDMLHLSVSVSAVSNVITRRTWPNV